MAVEKNKGKNIGIIILAAGESTRLGQPKQMLRYGDLTLLQHCIHVAHGSNANFIVVVVGAHADLVSSSVDDKTHFVTNGHWQEGMASSIRCGIRAALELDPSVDGLVFMVCDQPHVTSLLLNTLIATHQTTSKSIVASGYESTVGPPAFFKKKFFPELLELRGDVGAKNIIKQHAGEVEIVLFPQGNVDIDTEDDYQKLLKVTSGQ